MAILWLNWSSGADSVKRLWYVNTSFVIVALWDLEYMKFQPWLGIFLVNWRTTMHANRFLTIFQEQHIFQHSWKIFRYPFVCIVALQFRGKVFKSIKSRRQICPILLRRKKELSLWIREEPYMQMDFRQFSRNAAIYCTLRSGLHEIPTMIRNFPHEFENNHACKWTS